LTDLVGVGSELKAARESQGLAIDDVAQQLKFAPRQIESLEQEHFDRLPGPTIARGMVRNYARLLKLDPEPLLERMAPKVEKAPDAGRIAARFRQPVPFSDGTKRSSLLYAGFSVGLLVLVGAVAYEWQQEKATPEFVAPAQSQRPQPEEITQTAAVVQSPSTEVPQSPQASAEPAAEEEEKPAAAYRPLAPGTHRLVLRTEGEAWLEVKDGEGRMLVSSLNPPGTQRVVRGRPPFEIVIGNASLVKLTYNDKPIDLRPYTKVQVARFTLK
jgi:cytoskeleton protein RodZ